MRLRIAVILILVSAGCRQKEAAQPIEYTGPLREAENVDMLYSENDRIKVKMKAAKILEFKTGRPSPSHQRQLDLYVEAVKALFPGAPVVGRLVYAD
jgi:hypothetical protein